MSTLYITEYAKVGQSSAGPVQVGQEPSVAEQNLSVGGSSVQSAAFGSSTKFVRVHTDVVCSVKFGSDPTAVATEKRMGANSTEFFAVLGGDKVAVITNT